MEILSQEKESKRNKVLSKRQELDERFKRLTATVLLITTFLVAALSGCAKGNNQNNPTTTPTSTIETVKPSDQPTDKPSPTYTVAPSPTYTASPTPTVVQLTEAEQIVKAVTDIYNEFATIDNTITDEGKRKILDYVYLANGYESQYFEDSELTIAVGDNLSSRTDYVFKSVAEIYNTQKKPNESNISTFFLNNGAKIMTSNKNTPELNQMAQDYFDKMCKIYIDGESETIRSVIINSVNIDFNSLSPICQRELNRFLNGITLLLKDKMNAGIISIVETGDYNFDNLIIKIDHQVRLGGGGINDCVKNLIPVPDDLAQEVNEKLGINNKVLELSNAN